MKSEMTENLCSNDGPKPQNLNFKQFFVFFFYKYHICIKVQCRLEEDVQ